MQTVKSTEAAPSIREKADAIWFSASALVSLPGMPGTARGVTQKGHHENWRSRKRSGIGGGTEYHISSLPPETQQHLQSLASAESTQLAEKTKLVRTGLSSHVYKYVRLGAAVEEISTREFIELAVLERYERLQKPFKNREE
ncbi:hypothetical protein JYQ62_22065 [Nostoc sp. UHCC 0702]|nr:hypothetical protein JYQ62_22065 [Nostoc sp. UHCC 0702]